MKLQNFVSASCAGDIAVLRVGGDALDPGLHLGRDLGEHVGVAVHAVHADGRVSTNILISTTKCFALISDVCKPVVLKIRERTAGVSPASAEVRLVSARGADVELTVIIEVTVFYMTALHSLRNAGVAVPALVVGDDLHLDLHQLVRRAPVAEAAPARGHAHPGLEGGGGVGGETHRPHRGAEGHGSRHLQHRSVYLNKSH